MDDKKKKDRDEEKVEDEGTLGGQSSYQGQNIDDRSREEDEIDENQSM